MGFIYFKSRAKIIEKKVIGLFRFQWRNMSFVIPKKQILRLILS